MLQDYLTKYPEAVVTKSTAGAPNIKALEEIFGRHGYPDKIVTDNGPPWNGTDSHEMQQYLEWAGVEHDPTWSADDPEANGLTERFMQTIGKSWATAIVEGKDPLIALNSKIIPKHRTLCHQTETSRMALWKNDTDSTTSADSTNPV